MARIVLWTLRQRRYQALAALMAVVALGCIGAGTWQVLRLQQKVRDNNALDRNAHAAPVSLGSLVPLVGAGPAPSREAIRYRTVTLTGSYLDQPAQFLRNQTQDGINGYYVVGAVRGDGATLLVVRGFVAAAPGTGAPPAGVAAPPAATVTVTGRLQTADTRTDAAARLPGGQLESVNPAEQAIRLGGPVYDAYLTLDAGQPGTDGVSVLPAPDLANPAGGAVEPQHVAYVVQWYLFAILALAAPFAVARHELRDAQARFLGIDPDGGELTAAAELGSGGAALAVRDGGSLALRAGVTPQQWRRAARLADRYERSLSTESDAAAAPAAPPRSVRPAAASTREPYRLPNSAIQPHRAQGGDAYQGAYNDYLWQLALADGRVPAVDVSVDGEPATGRRALPAPEAPGEDGPTVIEGTCS